MNLQGRELSIRMEGEDVQLLQRELRQLGLDIHDSETEGGVFGRRTHEAVALFQKQHRLEPTGVVDERTAAMINAEVDSSHPSRFAVRGQIVKPDGGPVAGITVRAFDKTLRQERELGEAETDPDGRYAIHYSVDQLEGRSKADLILRAFDEAGEVLATSPLILGAPAEQVVDLSVGDETYRGPSEYDRLRTQLEPLLGDVGPADLNEEEVAYLAAKTRLDPVRVAYLAKSARLEAKSGIPAEAFYGLFRQELPTSLPALIAQDPAVRQRALETAIRENVVGAGLRDGLDQIQEQLQDQIVEHALDTSEELEDRTSLGALLDTAGGIDNDKQRSFLQTYLQHEGPIEEFWQELGEDQDFGADTVEALQSTLQLGALTLNHLPLVKVLQQQKQADEFQSMRDLAKLERADWEGLIRQEIDGSTVGVPPTIPGEDEEAKVGNYAKTMTRLVEDAFPTAVIAHRIEGEEGDDLPHAEGLTQFFTANPDFDFGATPIDDYLAGHESALEEVEDAAEVKTQLRGIQRLFNIAPRYEKYDAIRPLMRDGVDSAHAARRTGKAAFLRRYAGPLGETRARQVYANAGQAHGMALTLFARHGADMDSVPLNVTPERPTEVEGIPASLKNLFGSLDLCSCEHCRSVYSPAAYLVDVLHWLTDRGAVNDEEGKSALEVLFERRADIGRVELNCENTNTVLPYVDLVNEVLENAVLRESGSPPTPEVPQTEATAEELRVHPEHLNAAAYDVLADEAVFPWSLPFDLWAAEARGYLDHLGVPRHKIMDVFRQEGEEPAPADIAGEHLGLTPGERKIITGETSGLQPREFWGMSGDDWASKLRTVSTFLDQSALSYQTLEELLGARFINPSGELRVEFSEPATCNLDQAQLTGISDTGFTGVLDRAHRFVRLQRALGWGVHELDFALQALPPNDLTDDFLFLIQLSHVKHLKAALKEPLISMLSWWFRLDTAGSDHEPSLYARLFLNQASITPVDAVFELNATGDELENSGVTIDEHTPAILGALGIGAKDLALLVEVELSGGTELNLENLSALYRAVSLARALKLSVPDFLTLRTLSGIDPFDDPAATRRFVEAAGLVRNSRFDLDQLDYLLRHHARPNSPVVPGEEEIGQVLGELRGGLRKIASEHRFAPDPIGERTAQALATVLTEEEAKRGLALIDGTSKEEPADQQQFIDDHFALFLDGTDAKAELIDPGTLTKTEERIDYVLELLLEHLRRSASETLVKQKLADRLGLEMKASDLLLGKLLPSRADAAQEAIADFLALAPPAGSDEDSETSEDETPGAPLTAEDFPTQFEQFRLLDKVAAVINGFDVPTDDIPSDESSEAPRDELTWVFDRGPGLEWLNLRELPLSEADPADPDPALFEPWSRMAEMARLREELPSGEPTLFELLRMLNDSTTTEEAFRTSLTDLTGWREEDLAFLMGSDGFDLTFPDDYQDEQGLLQLRRLKRVLEMSRRLGVSAEQVWGWNTPSVEAGQAHDIRQAVRAKYDEDRWLAVAAPLRDELRERQRAALVAHVVHQMADRGVTDANDLFGHFLIDAEMSACMLTSRIKQANSSVQLFVQRCLMNLEPEVALTPEDAEEWAWMKNYRVWEANRKVFLYPENWIEPELRDDKSPFFEDLENELLQNDVTPETTEPAFVRYLEKLDEVARLEIAGMYHEDDANVMHVFGRTRGTPHIYYYRRWVDKAYWTPWERVDADIEGDHLIPVIWNRRLHLFWPIFTEKAEEKDPPKESEGGEKPEKYWEVQMAWSEYRNEKWSAKRVTEEKIDNREGTSKDVPLKSFFFNAKPLDNGILSITWHHQTSEATNENPGVSSILGRFSFKGCDGSVESRWIGTSGVPRISPLETSVAFMKFEQNQDKHPEYPLELPSDNSGRVEYLETLGKTPGTFYIAHPHQYWFVTQAPFFYEDVPRTFLVVPRGVDVDWHLSDKIGPATINAVVEYAVTVTGESGVSVLPGDRVLSPGDGVVDPASPGGAGPVSGPGELIEIVAGGSEVIVRPGGIIVPGAVNAAGNAPLASNVGTAGGGIPTAPIFAVPPATDAMTDTPGTLAVRPMASVMETVGAVLAENGGHHAVSILGFGKRYRFEAFYHPYVCLLMGELNSCGIDGLLAPKPDGKALALRRQAIREDSFGHTYEPTNRVSKYPVEEVDFSYGGAYSPYNWELFFHAPFMIANRLSQNQRFAEAQKWYHYIFDPTVGDATHGLAATYFDNIDLTGPSVTRIDPTIDFDWEETTGSPDPAIGSNKFSARWTGKVQPEHTETYTFHTRTDDGVRLWVDGRLLIDQWVDQPITRHSGTIDLEAGKLYEIKMEYYENAGGAIAHLMWSSPSIPEAVIPHERLYADVALGTPARFWKTKPLYEAGKGQHIQELMLLLGGAGSDAEQNELREEIEEQVKAWREQPFKPHLIARMRNVAYQKAIVIKYLDNLIAWGDHLFRRDTIESINEATQLYVLAAQILGDRPKEIPTQEGAPTIDGMEVKTFDDLEEHLDEFSNALVDLETVLPPATVTDSTTEDAPTSLILGPTLFFCIPRNDKLLSYWDTVADRLFKIRHCMNIEGVVRQLSLFEPPIDPGMLVRATAAGVDIGSALGDLNAPLPHYRFQVMLQKAVEFCADVKALGAALLSALEKRDAEELALLRSGHEVQLLTAIRQVKERQVEEAEEALEALTKSQEIAQHRRDYYEGREYMNAREEQSAAKQELAHIQGEEAQALKMVVKTLALIPSLDMGSSGWAGSPVLKTRVGGREFASAVDAFSDFLSFKARRSNQEATMASTLAGYDRRQDDWTFQAEQASKEIEQIEKQIAAAGIRLAIAEKDLQNHERQIENANEVDAFVRDKYTSVELYNWMVSQISTIYFQSYQMAYDMAKRAEKAFGHELAAYDSANFIQFGYWDSLKKGLLSGEKLHYDLKRMEASYLDRNRREYEITQHVSLAMLHPEALIMLRETGECFVNLPEAVFDLAYPGHYMRRIKTVGVTIPCVTGPYTNVSSTLTLLGNRTRRDTRLNPEDPEYIWTGDNSDPRFVYDTGGIQSVVTSSGQADSGLFEPNLRDERYLPFEGAGAISTWRIELPKGFRQFDYDTVSDVVLHLRYTARDGGASFKETVEDELQIALNDMLLEEGRERGLFRLFSAKQEFPSEWHRFLHPSGNEVGQHLVLGLGKQHFPSQFRDRSIRIRQLTLFLKLRNAAYDNDRPVVLSVKSPDGAIAEATLQGTEVDLGGLPQATVDYADSGKDLSDWRLQATNDSIENLPQALTVEEETTGTTRRRLDPDVIEDIGILFHYKIEEE